MSDQQNRSVLVVEDEPLILEVMQTALEEGGFAVIAASGDAEAIAALERDSGRDLLGLITDIRLQGARSGWDIAHMARELCPGLPVVYVTGDSGHEWSAHGVPQSTLVPKPFAYAQVVIALSNLLNQTDSEM